MKQIKYRKILTLLLIFFIGLGLINITNGAPKSRKSYISYLYPAGGEKGSSIELIVGGQFINQTLNVTVNHPGITLESVKLIPRTRNLSGYDRKALINRLVTILGGTVSDKRKIPRYDKQGVAINLAVPNGFSSDVLKGYSDFYLKYLLREIRLRKAPSQALDTRLLVKLKIADNVPKGKYYLQLDNNISTKTNNKKRNNFRKILKSNKFMFIVGDIAEFNELKKSYIFNNKTMNLEKKNSKISLPCLINGRIIDGEIDQYKFIAKQNEKIAIKVVARELMPFIGDGVPGWFQAVIGIKDARNNKEVAFVDDFQNNPDPTMIFKVPRDGEYIIYIRDAIYRGREDFVYRMKIGKFAVVNNIYPRGGFKYNEKQFIRVNGTYLPKKILNIDNTKLKLGINNINYDGGTLKYHVSKYNGVDARNSNLVMKNAYKVKFPTVINGRVTSKNNIHYYKFNGKKNQNICLEVFAKRLDSPLDSVVRLYNSNGKIIASNDDFKRANIGLITHHSDSFLNYKLPKNDIYYFDISDASRSGGNEYSYRLELKPQKYDFDAVINSYNSSSYVGYNIPITINFANYFSDVKGKYYEIKVKNYKVPLMGNVIPASVKEWMFTMNLSNNLVNKHADFEFIVNLRDKNKKIIATKDVIIGQKMMQAFIYYHWLPIGDFVLNILPRKRYLPILKWQNKSVSFDKKNEVELTLLNKSGAQSTKKSTFTIYNAPKGINIKSSSLDNRGNVKLILTANKDFDKDATFHKNLIVMMNYKNTYYKKTKNTAKKDTKAKIDTKAKKDTKAKIDTKAKTKVTKIQPIFVLDALIIN